MSPEVTYASMSPEVTYASWFGNKNNKAKVVKPHQLHTDTHYLPNLSVEFTLKYHIVFIIGWGGFGIVAKVTSKAAKDLSLACKFITKSKLSSQSLDPGTNIPREVEILKNVSTLTYKKLKHENIIAFHDFYQDDNYYYLITECHGEATPRDSLKTERHVIDLFEYIEINSYLSEHTVKKIFKQIMSAISYMHSKGLVHGDIKDENILIDENGKVKLIDFGSSSCFTQKKFTRFLGTIQYASPEILRGDSSYDGPAAEVWALGCCLYTMLTGQIPFRSKRHALLSSFYPPSRPLSSCSNDLLLKMLEKDPKLRCSISDIISHEWFK